MLLLRCLIRWVAMAAGKGRCGICVDKIDADGFIFDLDFILRGSAGVNSTA